MENRNTINAKKVYYENHFINYVDYCINSCNNINTDDGIEEITAQ